MKSCSSWANAIIDCALGQKQEPDLAAHLETCSQCQNALRARREMAARMDEALRRSAAVEPPLYGPARVMGRVIASIDRPTDTRAWWRWPVVGSTAAMLVAVLIGILVWVRRPAPQADVTALSTWRSPTEALLRPPVSAAWTTMPRLGERYFKIRPSGEMHAQ
jgi:anti-sigma factor RsiW